MKVKIIERASNDLILIVGYISVPTPSYVFTLISSSFPLTVPENRTHTGKSTNENRTHTGKSTHENGAHTAMSTSSNGSYHNTTTPTSVSFLSASLPPLPSHQVSPHIPPPLALHHYEVDETRPPSHIYDQPGLKQSSMSLPVPYEIPLVSSAMSHQETPCQASAIGLLS